MSELDRKFHKESRRNSLPKDSRFVVKVRDVSTRKWKESLAWDEAEEEILEYKHGGKDDVEYLTN